MDQQMFDGDEITVHIEFIKKVADAYQRLRISAAPLDLAREGKFSNIVALPQPVSMCWSNYLQGIDKLE